MSEVSTKKGQIVVNTQDLLPIIKKWLYSQHDIFFRELISNACDAITKRHVLSRGENVEIPQGKIVVEVDSKNKVLKIHDNGLGMTEAEVEKYLAQLAFSGAQEFVEKMKAQGTNAQDIIGKFGLGFYSIFMVASKVEVESLSMTPGSAPTKWVCEGETDYEFLPSDKTEIGTTITAHMTEEAIEYLSLYKARSIITKYCRFMPFSIFIKDLAAEKTEEGEEKAGEEDKATEDKAINQTEPLWKKDPTQLKDEDYLAFYRELFPVDQDPLFWLHLKVDHPFDLQGILYFPKFNREKPIHENNIHLYARQVFVADTVKDIVPEFLGLLKGSIDSPDIPLNVSRSSLQGDPNVKKISNYIVKKVAESLKKLFNTNREKFEKVWPDIGLFVKYGVISDEKFDEMMREFILFKSKDHSSPLTLQEYQDKVPALFHEKLKGKILYYEQGKCNLQLLDELEKLDIPFVQTDSYIDPHFMQHLEFKKQGDSAIKFVSVDSEFENLMSQSQVIDEDMNQKVKGLFEKTLGKLMGEELKKNLDVDTKNFSGNTTSYIKVDEQMRRLQQMTKNLQGAQEFPIKKTFVINPNKPLVQNLVKLSERGENDELVETICYHLLHLSQFMSDSMLEKDKTKFIHDSESILEKLTQSL